MTYIEKIADALARAVNSGRLSRSFIRAAAKGQKPRTLGVLGQGAEGIAQERTHPSLGTQVAKIYDQKGPWYSDRMFNRKTEIFRHLNRQAPKKSVKLLDTDTDKRIHFTEYLEDNGRKMSVEDATKLSKKFGISDISGGQYVNHNILNGKVMDFLPDNNKVAKTTTLGAHAVTLKKLSNRLERMYPGAQNLSDIDMTHEPTRRLIEKGNAVEAKLHAIQNAMIDEVTNRPKARIDRVLRQTYGKS